ncbi:MAG: right-handed parallel beta-helix repeat-containing protein [Desulfurellales bacterium]|nr:MAG: right-handed parallel beta-helix repeat-containing protein [Desulfurellales bacterium]
MGAISTLATSLTAAGITSAAQVRFVVDHLEGTSETKQFSLAQLETHMEGVISGMNVVATYSDLQNLDVPDESIVFWNDTTRGGIFRYDSGSSATTNTGTVIECLAAGGGRFLRQYSGPVNAVWFQNVDKSGATSSLGGLQAAVNTGEDVYLPAGDYHITDNLFLRNSSQRIFGDGVRTRIYQETRGKTVFYAQSNPSGTRLTDICIEKLKLECVATGTMSSTTDQGCAVFALKVHRFTVRECIITGFAGYVVYLSDAWVVDVNDNVLYGNLLNSLQSAESSYDIYVLGRGIRVHRNWCLSQIKVNINVNSDVASETMAVQDNICIAWDSANGRMSATGSVVPVNNIVLHYGTGVSTEFVGVVICTGNIVIGSRCSGIYISDETAAADGTGARAIVSGNIIMDSGCSTSYNSDTIQGGLCVMGGREIVANENLIINHQGAGTPALRLNIVHTGAKIVCNENIVSNSLGYGIDVRSKSGALAICDNVLHDHRRYGINVWDTSGTYDRGPVLIDGNIVEYHATGEVSGDLYGIWVDYTDADAAFATRITGNVVRRKSTGSKAGSAIYFRATNMTISGNYVRNFNRAIYNPDSIAARATGLFIDANRIEETTYAYDFTTGANGAVLVQRPLYGGTVTEKLRNANTTVAIYEGIQVGERWWMVNSAAPAVGGTAWLAGDRVFPSATNAALVIAYSGSAWVSSVKVGSLSSAYTATNVTTDRTYDANATSIDELADIVGTLIADLKTANVIP